ncbi:MAG: hypothetical protein KGL97_00035, partial [Alphaproteobacteria bacterium]|nr:hypothetical protein [Alphaproteobacteria bacterium]
MQLKIQRSQRASGALGNTAVFCLDVQADYSAAELDSIRKYQLGPEVVYNSETARRYLAKADSDLDRTQPNSARDRMAALARGALYLWMAKINLNITVASLGKGHHIECRDLEELLMAEDTVRFACKNVTRYLEIAATFDGRATVIGYDKNGETVHIADLTPPLLGRLPDTPLEERGVAIRQEWAVRQAAMASAALEASNISEDVRRETTRLAGIARLRARAVAGKIVAYAAKNWTAEALAQRWVRARELAGMAGRDFMRLVRKSAREALRLAAAFKRRWLVAEGEVL